MPPSHRKDCRPLRKGATERGILQETLGVANDGPDATAIVVRCVAYKPSSGSYRVTEDTILRLPAKTSGVALEVLDTSSVVDLKVFVRTADASPRKSDGTAPGGTGVLSYAMPPVLHGVFRRRRSAGRGRTRRMRMSS